MIDIPQNTDGRKAFDKEVDRATSEALDKLSKKNWAELDGRFVDHERGYTSEVLYAVKKAFEDKGYYVIPHGQGFLTGIDIEKYAR